MRASSRSFANRRVYHNLQMSQDGLRYFSYPLQFLFVTKSFELCYRLGEDGITSNFRGKFGLANQQPLIFWTT